MLGSGTVAENSPVYKQSVQLGLHLAQAGFNVCHGGYGGVMEGVARGCRLGGGHNTGITIQKKGTGTFGLTSSPARGGVPVLLQKRASPRNRWVDAEIAMPSWERRLLKLIKMSDAYVFLDGATGTLTELLFVWEMANKKLHAKPVILLGKRLRNLVKFLKKDPSLKIPENFYLASTLSEALKILTGHRS